MDHVITALAYLDPLLLTMRVMYYNICSQSLMPSMLYHLLIALIY